MHFIDERTQNIYAVAALLLRSGRQKTQTHQYRNWYSFNEPHLSSPEIITKCIVVCIELANNMQLISSLVFLVRVHNTDAKGISARFLLPNWQYIDCQDLAYA
jgi:hypothetical protein